MVLAAVDLGLLRSSTHCTDHPDSVVGEMADEIDDIVGWAELDGAQPLVLPSVEVRMVLLEDHVNIVTTRLNDRE